MLFKSALVLKKGPTSICHSRIWVAIHHSSGRSKGENLLDPKSRRSLLTQQDIKIFYERNGKMEEFLNESHLDMAKKLSDKIHQSFDRVI